MAAMLLLLLAGGCSLQTDEGGIAVLPQFRASTAPLPEPGVPPIVEVQINAAGLVTTTGQLVATCDRGAVDAKYEQQADNLKLRVIYIAPAGCTEAPTLLEYTIFLSHVPPGIYHYTVVHEGDRQVPTGTAVAEQDITVF
jgi:hypothetical protein